MAKHPLTLALVAVNVIVFLLVFSMPEELRSQTFGLLSFSWAAKLEVWRWLTSLFMHASASHLFFNMLGLYFFGKDLEEGTSKWRFLAVYFMAGLLGNLAFALTDAAPVVGASGCIFGLLGAAMLLNPAKAVSFYVVPLPLGVVAVSFILVESLMASAGATAVTGVAHAAHLAGLAMGAVFAVFFDPKKAAKGMAMLMLCFCLLVFLWPLLSFVTSIGSLVLQFLDALIGFVLYNVANLLSFVWTLAM